MTAPSGRISFQTSGNVRRLPQGLWDSLLLRACRREAVARTPVWLMRQAGRYMAHYRGIRGRGSFLSLCKDAEACAEVALHARSWLDVDAAIVFSDILVVLEALGMELTFDVGEGPRLPRPLTEPGRIAALRDPLQAARDLAYVHQAVRLTVAGSPPGIPCIGFCGGPFTLASYALEGGTSRHFLTTKRFMRAEPEAWASLQGTLTACLAEHCRLQVEAGASCLQIFDSWIGCLTADDCATYVAPALRALIAALPSGIPVILFGTGMAHLAPLLAGCGADVLGIDTTGDLTGAFDLPGLETGHLAVQGHLDPSLLLAPRALLLKGADQVLAQARGRRGHIFNLGHGVQKETDPEAARLLVAHVHEASAAGRA